MKKEGKQLTKQLILIFVVDVAFAFINLAHHLHKFIKIWPINCPNL